MLPPLARGAAPALATVNARRHALHAPHRGHVSTAVQLQLLRPLSCPPFASGHFDGHLSRPRALRVFACEFRSPAPNLEANSSGQVVIASVVVGRAS